MTNLNSFIDSINALKLKDEHLEIEARFQEISYKNFTSLFNVLRKGHVMYQFQNQLLVLLEKVLILVVY